MNNQNVIGHFFQDMKLRRKTAMNGLCGNTLNNFYLTNLHHHVIRFGALPGIGSVFLLMGLVF